MCGIAGVVYSDPVRRVDPQVLSRMAASIAHRGPDAEGVWDSSRQLQSGRVSLSTPATQVGLVHRRLSIIDLESGRQPIGNEDDSVQIVFNGEIYNFRELRRDLESRGHSFRTQSDTEVIVHLYEEFGEDCVSRLRGMFAFAIWDGRRRKLFLARDRVGIKPLFVRFDAGKLVFGSELKAVLAHGGIPRELDPAALDEFLYYGMVPGGRCIFRGIEKLLPGHTMTLDVDTWHVERRRYWQLRFAPDSSLGIREWQEALLEKLREAVQLHMIADVPVGSFLSGGLDSSVVTGLASETASVPLQTFSMGFRESKFNELPAAREVASHFGTEHTEEVVTADVADLLPKLAFHYDEPFADSSAIPTFLVSQIAARHVKVVLSGDGGDEAMVGYSRYAHDLKEAGIRNAIPSWMRGRWLTSLASAWPKADWLPRPLRLKTVLTNLSLSPAEAYANTLSLCRQPLRHRLLNADVRASVSREAARSIAASGFENGCDDLSGMIAADMSTLLPDDYLVKVDRASMANGLEVRPPLLDHEFLELCATIPSEFKIRSGETKWLLRETAKSMLPPEILNRPKQGFEIPLDDWLRGPLKPFLEDSVLAGDSPIGGLIDQSVARRMFDRHQSGTGRHGSTLWSLLSLAFWAEQHLKEPVGANATSVSPEQLAPVAEEVR
jgi:asparagine synthase (glutamine-hydrolysing)